MRKLYVLLGISCIIGGCCSLSDSEIFVRTSPQKRSPKPEYMPPEEKPIPASPGEGVPVPIAPQIGIRVPLEK